MKLHEIAKPTPSSADTWLKSMNIKNYTIKPDGVVDVDGDVDLRKFKGTTFPVQFGNITGYFSCHDTNVTSLQGAPSTIGGDFFCYETPITSLAGCPSTVGGSFYCFDTKITSLSGIHKLIHSIHDEFWCSRNVTHILGVLWIKGITNINVVDGGPIDNIMNKYLGTGNVIMAQDELLDVGFIEQAKL